jgi:hypothetical protein
MTAPVLDRVALHDGGSVMQGFTRTPAGGWIFTQVMQEGRFGKPHDWHMTHGDLTLTRLDSSGTILSWMYLKGFGHGQGISVQSATSQPWIWIEAVSQQGPDDFPDGFGTQIARFKWHPGATINHATDGVHLYDPLPGNWRLSPCLAGDLISVRYTTPSMAKRFAVYQVAGFLARDFTPLWTIDQPSVPGTPQGWALLPGGKQVAMLTGTAYSDTNPPPGNTFLTIFGKAGVVSRTFVNDGQGLSWREPEGVQAIGGRICYGFASGPADGRKASIYCQ